MTAHLENCLHSEYLAVDTEGFTAETILGISVAHYGLETMYFPIGHSEDVNIDDEISEALRHTLLTVPYRIFHNAGHDLTILPYLTDKDFVDTMIMGHMVDENVMSKSLDYMCKFYLDDEGKRMHPLMKSIIDTMGWYHVPYALMNDYAGHDALITMR